MHWQGRTCAVEGSRQVGGKENTDTHGNTQISLMSTIWANKEWVFTVYFLMPNPGTRCSWDDGPQ